MGNSHKNPLFSIFSLAAILVGSRDHRTHFGRGPFHQSLVAIGSVVSEEKIFMLGQLKPNCPGMIIARSSTNFLFFMPFDQDGPHSRT
jgi:hypothetical protein